MFKFAAKVGIISGVAYYLAKKGVWEDSDTTHELYQQTKKEICPYIKKATAQLPFEMPSLPQAENVTQISKYYWNAGVKNTFHFISNSPTYFKNWGKSAYDSMIEFTKSPEAQEK